MLLPFLNSFNRMKNKKIIACILPTYKTKAQIGRVLAAIPSFVDKIYVVDDACPEKTGQYVQNEIHDSRIQVIFHEVNQGVGGAVITGYQTALKDGVDIMVKVDSDGQMDPALIADFIAPIVADLTDYVKGNRFYYLDKVSKMPPVRLFGNAVLSLMNKASSGYWQLFDPTNGYTAISRYALTHMEVEKCDKRYFFESDMLFRLNLIEARVMDLPMDAVYADEKSNLKISKILMPFLKKHIRNFFKRLFYQYIIRDFSLASLNLLMGSVLLLFGGIYGVSHWVSSAQTGQFATSGQVMIAALPILIGIQMLFSFLNFDILRSSQLNIHHRQLVMKEQSNQETT